MADSIGKQLNQRLASLDQQQIAWVDRWEDINDYILPRFGNFRNEGLEPNKGEDRQDLILDGTGTRALRTLAAGMHTGMTSPSRPWFREELPDNMLMKKRQVNQWLDDVEKIIYRILAQSNFYQVSHVTQTSLGGYATAVVIEEEDDEHVVRFRPITMGEYVLATDSRGVVDTMIRCFWQTARNLKNRFGSRCSDAVMKAAEKPATEDKFFEVVQAIYMRDNADPEAKTKDKWPWAHIYYEKDNPDQLLLNSGYQERALFAPRWLVQGADVYGRGPGDDALPDVKQLQAMKRSLTESQQFAVRPPVGAPTAHKGKIALIPGGLSVRDGTTPDAIKPLYEVKPDLAGGVAALQDQRQQIREAFYNDLFLMLLGQQYGQPPTAREVVERKEEKLIQLGPVVERQFNEYLEPIIDRTFYMAARKGMLPPAPRILEDAAKEGMEVKPKFVSILAQAQQLVGIQNIRIPTDYALSVAPVVPDILDTIKWDEVMDQMGQMAGSPTAIYTSQEEREQIRKMKAQAAQQAQALEAAQGEADVAKTLGETPSASQEGTALADISQAA